MTKCIPFSVICFLSQSGMTSDGYRRGYLSFAHFCYIFVILQAEDLEGIGEITYSIKSTTPSLPGYFQIPNPRDGRLILTRTIDFKQTIVSGPVQNTSGV